MSGTPIAGKMGWGSRREREGDGAEGNGERGPEKRHSSPGVSPGSCAR